MTDAWDGRPQNPERDGWHWVRCSLHPSYKPAPWLWAFDEWQPQDGDYLVINQNEYLGPCALPDEVATLRAEIERLVAALAETHAENARLREALEYAVPVLEEGQEALVERDDVCVTADGDDAMAVAILKARAALSEPAP